MYRFLGFYDRVWIGVSVFRSGVVGLTRGWGIGNHLVLGHGIEIWGLLKGLTNRFNNLYKITVLYVYLICLLEESFYPGQEMNFIVRVSFTSSELDNRWNLKL